MITYKDKVLRDIRTFFELDEDDYYKPIRTGNVFSSNYIEYESNDALPVKKCHDIIRPYLSGIINNHKIQGEWKTHFK